MKSTHLGCIDILSKPSPGTGDGDGGVEVVFEFIEARGEAAELLEVGEGAFDAVALPIEGTVEAALDFADGSGRDDGGDAALAEMVEDEVGVVALVGEHRPWAAIAEQHDGLGAVIGLAAGQHEAERQPEGIGKQVDLGRQTSSTPPQSALRSPFFRADAAC
jgi:hypothetical protein